MRVLLLVVAGLATLLAFDAGYFDDRQQAAHGGAISEGFIRKGALGRILRDGGYLGLSADSGKMVSDTLCAPDAVLKGYDRHDLFRLRVSVQTNIAQDLRITVSDSRQEDGFLVSERLTIEPREEIYAVYFNADRRTPLSIVFSTSSRQVEPVRLGEIAVDGQFGRQQILFDAPEVLAGAFTDDIMISSTAVNGGYTGVAMDQPGTQLQYNLPEGIAPALYAGTFPGKKNQGFCRYSAIKQPPSKRNPQSRLLPDVKVDIAPAYLLGDQGIVTNRESKGKTWEVPATVTIDNGETAFAQQVGIRAHGGTKGRKQDIESYRLYSRRGYGKRSLESQVLFDPPGSASLEALVLKYTYQVYGDHKEEFNPFLHAMAMDIANKIGALVPRHRLVNFEMNGEPKGLYLAMEHLSDRTVRNWLGRDNFIGYTYKKYNTPREQDTLYLLLAQITAEKGEAAFDALLRFYSLDNVLNSIILSAYIADDDYCQGMEIIDNLENLSAASITSVNWDLDHGFLLYKGGAFSATPQRPGFRLIKPAAKSLCPRRMVYSWVYSQSSRFRTALRNRLESTLSDELSLRGMEPELQRYREINAVYYDGRHSEAIEQLLNYIRLRPKIMLDELKQIEAEANNPVES